MSQKQVTQSLTDPRWVWIRIRECTRATLLKRGKKGDTYDDVIRELIAHAEAL
jgi:hypothetical protein